MYHSFIVGIKVKIFVTDEFEDFMKLANVDDFAVSKVAKELASGLHDGNLDMNKLLEAYKLFGESLR